MVEILLIPGHGGKDNGTHGTSPETGGTIYEDRLNLNVALRVREKLAAYPGVRVVMSRTADVYVSPSDQLRLANSKKWAAVVAIHHNGAADARANGCEVLHTDFPGSEHLADCIIKQFTASGWKVHGKGDGTFVSPRNLALEKCTTSPVVYTEGAFLTGPDIAKVDTLVEQWAEANMIAYGTLVGIGVVK